MKTDKISFKKQTGLMAVGKPHQSVDIKLNKKRCGTINAPNWQSKDNMWSICLMVFKTEPDNNPNCNWKWITLAAIFENEMLARDWIKARWEGISKKYQIRTSED